MLAIALVGVVSTASATVIDFNTVGPLTGVNLLSVGTSYSEDGFQLVVSGDTFAAPGSLRAEYTGQPALVVNIAANVTRTITLTALSGNPFEVDSIDLAKWINTSTKTVSFTGNLYGGGTVLQSFNIPPVANFSLSTYSFLPTFTNLASLQWTTITSSTNVITTNNYHQFDNIVVQEQPIPEPSALALAIGGAAVLWLIISRARRGNSCQDCLR